MFVVKICNCHLMSFMIKQTVPFSYYAWLKCVSHGKQGNMTGSSIVFIWHVLSCLHLIFLLLLCPLWHHNGLVACPLWYHMFQCCVMMLLGVLVSANIATLFLCKLLHQCIFTFPINYLVNLIKPYDTIEWLNECVHCKIQ